MNVLLCNRQRDKRLLDIIGKNTGKKEPKIQNVQWISIEARDDGKNINIVTRGGSKTGVDVEKQEPSQHQWVKKNIVPQNNFDVQKEKEMFKEARQEILKENVESTSTAQQNHDRPMYEIPPSMDHTNKGQPSEQVCNLKTFLQSCVNLLNDPSSIKALQNFLERCNMKVEGNLE